MPTISKSQTQQPVVKRQLPSIPQSKQKQICEQSASENIPKEITQIEQWTCLKHTETIFDSMKDNWKKGSSTFDSIVSNKEKLIFFIETTDGISIGGVVKKKILSIIGSRDR